MRFGYITFLATSKIHRLICLIFDKYMTNIGFEFFLIDNIRTFNIF